MVILNKFKLSLLLLLLLVFLFWSFFWTRVPTEGYKSIEASAPSLRFGYFNQLEGDIGEWIQQFPDLSYFAASNELLHAHPEAQSYQIYPIYDGSSTDQSFNHAYSHVPAETLPGYGKSVYSITKGNTRSFFLSAARINEADDRQLDWIEQTISKSKQTYNIAWLSQDPKQPEVWKALRAAGISAVFIQDSVYVLDIAVTRTPSDYVPSPYESWNVWDLSKIKETPYMVEVEASDNVLTIHAENNQRQILDQLEVDSHNLAMWDLAAWQEKQEIPLVGTRSLWRYHPGSKEIKFFVPEGVDLVGEGPTIETYHAEAVQLPAYDWRSPEYDDSDWRIGRGPLGAASNKERQSSIQSKLALGKSPTYYFRKSFELDRDPKELSGLFLNISYEDGYVVYLNGQEVSRDAIISGVLTESSLAFPNDMTSRRVDITTHVDRLVKGTNVITVEVHRSHPGSPNLFFDLALSAESKAKVHE